MRYLPNLTKETEHTQKSKRNQKTFIRDIQMLCYEFKCPDCNLLKEIYRPVTDCHFPELCDYCGLEMRRVFRPPEINVFHDYYNHGLGIKVNKKENVKDHLKKVNDESGAEFNEVGNEAQNVKRKKSNYKLNRDEHQLFERMLCE